MSEPFFTIVTVVLNGEAEIAKTIKSVKSQSYREFEHLIIDGASSDATLSIAQELSYENLHIISQKDLGIYDAMNTGIEKGRGAFSLFLNCGDILPSARTLERVAVKMTERNILYFGSTQIEARTGVWQYPPLESSDFDKSFLPHHQSVFYPRLFLRHNRYDLRFKIQSDIDFTIRLKREYDMRYLKELLVISTLGGTTIAIFPYFRKTVNLANELIELKIKTEGRITLLGKLHIYALQISKYLICRVGGKRALFWAMRWLGKKKMARTTRS